jgi:hypothetical protein
MAWRSPALLQGSRLARPTPGQQVEGAFLGGLRSRFEQPGACAGDARITVGALSLDVVSIQSVIA